MAAKTRRVFKRVIRGDIRKGLACMNALIQWNLKHVDPSGTLNVAAYNQIVATKTVLLALLAANYQHP